MPITSIDLANQRIDLADVLSWRIAQSPKFINLFSRTTSTQNGEVSAPSIIATQTEHKWLEGVETPKTKAFTAYSYSSGSATFTVADSAGWSVGDLFHILGDSAVLRISSVTGTTIVVTSIASQNGSNLNLETYTAANGGTLIFDSRPIQEGSTSGESVFLQSGTASNYTQIFRADVDLTGTALAVGQYGNENNITLQIQHATDTIIRRMNSALIFGIKMARTASIPGSMGGLYYFGSAEDGLSNAQSGTPALKINMINASAQMITEAGGTPDIILCGAGQAQVISTFMGSQVRVDQTSQIVGRNVTQFVTSAGGNILRVFIDPAIPDTDVWVCDSRGFALVPLNGRALHSEPATAPGTDGVRAMIIGEYTAEFKNAKQSLCRISGLQDSATTLASTL